MRLSDEQTLKDVPCVHLSSIETDLNMQDYAPLNGSNVSDALNGSLSTELSSEITGISHYSSSLLNRESVNGEWSSAVGHAATGKSGRVIHNLQEEIARLRRECELQRSKAEELQRAHEAYRTQLQSTEESLRNYEQINETNLASISRKDRRIEELRIELRNEKNRRAKAESETRNVHQLMAMDKDEFNRKSAELQEVTNHARIQYDVLAKSVERDRADYQKKFKAIREHISHLSTVHQEREAHMQRLETIMAQRNREMEAGRERFEKLFQEYENYKRTRDEQVQELIDKGHARDAEIDIALASLQATEQKMKWAIQVKEVQKSG